MDRQEAKAKKRKQMLQNKKSQGSFTKERSQGAHIMKAQEEECSKDGRSRTEIVVSCMEGIRQKAET